MESWVGRAPPYPVTPRQPVLLANESGCDDPLRPAVSLPIRRLAWGACRTTESRPWIQDLSRSREQARRIASCSSILAPHGAALANLVFASPGTRVLELHQPGYAPPYFHSLAAHGQLFLARSEQPQIPPTLYGSLLYEGPIVEPIVLEPERVAQALEALLRFPEMRVPSVDAENDAAGRAGNSPSGSP